MILRRQAGDIIDKINTKRGDQSSTTRNWQRVAKSEEAKRKLFIDFTTNKRKNFYGREKRETRKQKFLSKRKSFAMKFYFSHFSTKIQFCDLLRNGQRFDGNIHEDKHVSTHAIIPFSRTHAAIWSASCRSLHLRAHTCVDWNEWKRSDILCKIVVNLLVALSVTSGESINQSNGNSAPYRGLCFVASSRR